MQQEQYSFDATFRDGYTLRHIIEYLKMTNVDGNFVFGPEGITYDRTNSQNTIINVLEIYGCEISYYFNPKNKGPITVGINIAEFSKNTKTIGKKDGFRIFKLMDSTDDRLCCQHVSNNSIATTNNNRSYISTKTLDYDYFAVDFDKPENKPNCTIAISEFAKACSGILTFKCSSIHMSGYEKTLQLTGMDSMDRVLKVNTLGYDIDHDDKKEVPIETIKTSSSLMKAFSKINNISPSNGNIKLYFDEELMKMVVSGGCYAKLVIYLRNASAEEEEG